MKPQIGSAFSSHIIDDLRQHEERKAQQLEEGECRKGRGYIQRVPRSDISREGGHTHHQRNACVQGAGEGLGQGIPKVMPQ